MTGRKITKPDADATPVEILRFDRVILDGLPFTYGQQTEVGYVLNRDDSTGRSLLKTQAELRSLAARKRLIVERDHYRPEHQEARLHGRRIALSDLNQNTAARTSFRSAIVGAANELLAEGMLTRTDEAIEANIDLIEGRPSAYQGRHPSPEHGHKHRAYENSWTPSPRTIRKWLKA